MNKKMFLTLFLALIVLCSVSAVQASDVNVTDSYATNLVDDTQDVSVPMENTADSSESSVYSDSNVDNDPSKVSLSSEEVLESDDSNTLSTSSDSNDVLDSDNGNAVVSSEMGSSDSIVSSKIDKSKTVQANDLTKYYKGPSNFEATFLDSNGKALANKDIKATIHGVTYTKKTDANGKVSFAINLVPGTYKVILENPSTGYKLTKTIKILSTIAANDVSKVREDGRTFYATFLNSKGKVLANKNIKFKVNGKTFTKQTNSKGVASLTLYNLKPGTYKIISYGADGLTKTNTIKVYKQVSSKLITKAYTFLKSDSKTIKVTLHNSLGYAPGAGKIVKITVNGKTYSRKTNSNGVASLKLPSLNTGVYTVKYKFDGNGYYKASSASNYVNIISTKNTAFTVKSATTFTYGSGTFKVALTAGGTPLAKKTITFTVDGKTYTKTTDGKGIASLPMDLTIGKHTIKYSVNKDSKINAKSGSSSVTINDIKSHHAYWLYGSDMKSVNLKDLSSKGVTDILLNFKAYELYGKSGVETWISSAKAVGINVHMWVQVFYQASTWTKPVVNGKENTAFFNKKISEIKTYAGINGLSGIHLDYLRFSGVEKTNNAAYQNAGGTEAINSFVKQVVQAVDSVNSKLMVSAALMPETTSSAKYYGQDYSVLSKSLDIVIPMIYKGNYGKDSSWITTTAKWYVDNSKGARVWVGLQTYVSDRNPTELSATDLSKDVIAGLNGKANGVCLFRYGVSDGVNFNSLSATTVKTKSVSIKNILTGANNLKKFYANNKRMPNTVTIGGYTFTLSEFVYLMSQAISHLNSNNKKDISVVIGLGAPSSPTGDTIKSKDLAKADYVTVAKNVVTYMNNNKKAPNYASSKVGKITYSGIADAFSRILSFYSSNARLPSYVTVSCSASGSSSGSSSSDSGSGLNEKNTIKDLTVYLAASKNCQVDNSKIKTIVNKLIKGLKTEKEKATAIFNYVRDTLSYSFYYNTKHGAVGTLEAKSGNCVDHSHLLVAMFRTADLPARYVHGTCKFTSGSTYGHVWTQVLIDGKWTVADATSSKNTLGKISNWNTGSFTLNGMYSSLSF